MHDKWHIVIDAATGEVVSLGTVVASPLRAGLAAVELSDADASALREGRGVWVAEARAVAALPAPVPEVTADQLRLWMIRCLGMTPPQIDDACREAAELA